MSASAAGSMGQALSFGWTVLRASRTAFVGQAATLFWTLGFGLLIFLVSSEGSALGLKTKTEQVLFLAMVWGPMTLGFLVAHGLRAVSKPASMALLPSLKRRAIQAVLGFAVLVALFGSAAASLLQVYGALNGAIFALGSFVVVFGLVIPGRLDVHSLLLLLVVGILGRSEIVPIVQGTEVPSLVESLLALISFLVVIPAALWLYRPRENAVEEEQKQRLSSAQRLGPDCADSEALRDASAGVRLRGASQFSRRSLGRGAQFKGLSNMLIGAVAGMLPIYAFMYFFRGGKMPSTEFTGQMFFMLMLVFPVITAASHHVEVPSATFSRSTLAEHCFFRLLRMAGAWIATVAVAAIALGGFLALVRDGSWEEWTFVLPVAALYVLPVFPWALALGLYFQSSRFIARWSIPGLEWLCSVAGLVLAQTFMVLFVLAAMKYVVSELGTGGPPKALWVAAPMVLAFGLLALRAAFRRYYASASLEPAV